jgi:hypothetical protein
MMPQPMLPKGLTTILEEYYEDNDRNFYVLKADYSSDIFSLDFIFEGQDANEKGSLFQNWAIDATGYIKSKIIFESGSSIQLLNNHPLLWEFTDTQCDLYFTGQCQSPEKLFYSLYKVHKELFGNYRSFDISFGESSFQPFQFTNGLLTSGPKMLMEKYGACLKENGMDFNITNERPPQYWNGFEYSSEIKDLKVFLIGETYVIAEEFSFKLLNETRL